MPILLDERLPGTIIVLFQGGCLKEEVQQCVHACARVWPIQNASSFSEAEVCVEYFAWFDVTSDDALTEDVMIFETFTVLDQLQFSLHKN